MRIHLTINVIIAASILALSPFRLDAQDSIGPLLSLSQTDIEIDSTINRKDTTESLGVEPIIVSAARDFRPAFELPMQIDTLDNDTLLLTRQTRTLPEALLETPGIMVQKTGHGQGSPFIRGFTGQQTLLLIDGIRLNNSVFRSGPNQYWGTVDHYSIRQIEVMKGAASVEYGSDAIGGVVNIATKVPTAGKDGEPVGVRVLTRGATAERSVVSRSELYSLFPNSLGVIVGVTVRNYGDLEGGKDVGTQEYTGYDERNVDVKAQYGDAKQGKLTAFWQQTRQDDAPRTHTTIHAIDWSGLQVRDMDYYATATSATIEKERSHDQMRDLVALQYEKKFENSKVDRLQASLSYQLQSETRFRRRLKKSGGVWAAEDSFDRQGFDCGTLGFWIQGVTDAGKAGEFLYGFEQYADTVTSSSEKISGGEWVTADIQGPVAADASYRTFGVFARDTIRLGSRVEAMLSARWDYAQADVDTYKNPDTGLADSMSDNWNALVGGARMSVFLDSKETMNLFTGVSRSFRAPNLMDLTSYDDVKTNQYEIPAIDLDAEYFLSAELGFKVNRKRIKGSASVFYTDIQDLIYRVPTGNVDGDGNIELTKKNIRNGYITGAEIDVNALIGWGVSVFASGALINGRVNAFDNVGAIDEDTFEYIDKLMPSNARFGVRFETDRTKDEIPYWIEALGVFADKADRLSASDKSDLTRIPPGGTPGYGIMTVRSGCVLYERFALSLAVENIFDKDYRIHSSGVNAPGRNFVATFDMAF